MPTHLGGVLAAGVQVVVVVAGNLNDLRAG
jgi:hypothetical protein